jgi:hypothetical protein
MKCANCDLDAFFVYQITKTYEIFYCGKHLPKFLTERKKAELLKTTDEWSAAKAEVQEAVAPQEPKPKRKKKVAEEPSEE